MSRPDPDLSSDALWTHLFAFTGYIAAIACIYAAVTFGRRQREPRLAIARELTVFAFFAVALWALESFALFHTAYYVYSPTFLDRLPRLQVFEHVGFLSRTKSDGSCSDFIRDFQQHELDGVPLSVVLLESSLTYAALRAARVVHPNIVAQPFLAGLCVATVDALLDPVVATSRFCDSRNAHVEWDGVGLWHWYVPFDKTQGNELALFYHVPLFNYAAWLGGPTLLVAAANLPLFWAEWGE